jgi:predicted polyphosphate/ATP-dependent NAD kinase
VARPDGGRFLPGSLSAIPGHTTASDRLSSSEPKLARIGLIVNPVAGIGGRAALKGSDDRALVEQARALGAEQVAPGRAVQALQTLAPAGREVELMAGAGEMGEDEARAAGFDASVVGVARAATTAEDTRAAATAMAEAGVDLLLFAGGDGTAVDVLRAIGERVPVVGIPAGVKMHSAVFGVNARSAGELALAVVRGRAREPVDAEVMDVDEEALRAGFVSPRLYGYLRVPVEPSLVQAGKARSGAAERQAQDGIAAHIVERVLPGRLCLIGPGTTTRAIMTRLGLTKTVLGVDAVRDGELVAADADERTLLALVEAEPARVIVTPVGGQGFVFGRGNQQLSAPVLRQVGPDGIVIVATDAKLAALGGRPLLVDTGDAEVDEMLSGYRRVIAGYEREVVYRIG